MSRKTFLGFFGLCFWSSLGWLSGDLLPATMAPVSGEGLHLLVIGVLGAMGWLVAGPTVDWMVRAKIAAMGTLLVAVPFLLLNEARGMASASLGSVVFVIIPVALMVVQDQVRLLPWGMAGVAGILVLLPVALPGTGAGFVGLGLQVAAAGATAVGLVRMRRLLCGIGLVEAVAAVGIGSGVVLVIAGMLAGGVGVGVGWGWGAVGGEVVRGMVIDLPQVVLLVWLVREVSALQVSARYLMAPLLTVLEGWFVMRTGPGLRMIVGLALLAGGTYGLLRREDAAAEAGLSLR